MNDSIFWSTIAVITAVFLGSCFGLYKLGRYIERRDLTRYFVKMTTDTYYEAYGDGFTAGALYQKKLAPACPRLEDEDGRY